MKRIIKLSERNLHRIVKESIDRILNENYLSPEDIEEFKKHAVFVNKAIDIVRNMGYEVSNYDPDRPYTFKVYNVEIGKGDKIAERLSRIFGCKPSDGFSANDESTLFQTNTRNYRIHVPWYTKTNFKTW